MKSKFVVLLLAIAACCQAQGQLQKGTVLLGTSTNLLGGVSQFGSITPNNFGLQFGKSKYKSGNFESESTITAFNLSPTVGVMASNNVMVGLSAGVAMQNFKYDGGNFKLTSLAVSPFVRAYLKSTGKSLPYFELRGGVNSLKYDDDEGVEAVPFFGTKFGSAIFLNPKLSLDLFVDYNFSKDKNDNGNNTSTTTQSLFGFGMGFSVFL